jgi:hypothetical protein
METKVNRNQAHKIEDTRNTLETPVWGKPTKEGLYWLQRTKLKLRIKLIKLIWVFNCVHQLALDT